jgi:hypothetical protein
MQKPSETTTAKIGRDVIQNAYDELAVHDADEAFRILGDWLKANRVATPQPAAAMEGAGEPITHKGQTWKYTGETRKPRAGEHFATGFGSQVCIATYNYETSEYRIVVKAEPAAAQSAETGEKWNPFYHKVYVRNNDGSYTGIEGVFLTTPDGATAMQAEAAAKILNKQLERSETDGR